MTATFTTDNIDGLQAVPLAHPRGWRIRFHSSNDGLCHQLYVNGRLADFTETDTQRQFMLRPVPGPAELVVAAVSASHRHKDLSGRLTNTLQNPGWVYRHSSVRSLSHRPGHRIILLGDEAAGGGIDTALHRRQLWPAWLGRWGWGEDPFALGGFGYDGAAALGFGKGAFGAGPFAFGAGVVEHSVPLPAQGVHQLKLRVLGPDGQSTDSAAVEYDASPPPPPPGGLSVSSYDAQTDTLTFQIQRGES